MQHNSWQKDDNPDLFQPYESLSAEEKIKDLEQLKVALDLKYSGNKQIQDFFNQAYNATK
jgi:hypothetical protein